MLSPFFLVTIMIMKVLDSAPNNKICHNFPNPIIFRKASFYIRSKSYYHEKKLLLVLIKQNLQNKIITWFAAWSNGRGTLSTKHLHTYPHNFDKLHKVFFSFSWILLIKYTSTTPEREILWLSHIPLKWHQIICNKFESLSQIFKKTFV